MYYYDKGLPENILFSSEEKIMKKILSLVIVICCLSLLCCLPAQAAGENEVLFVVDPDGDTITVDIKTEFSCGGVQGILSYDGSEIAYEESSFASALASINSASNSFSDSSGATKVALVCAADGGVNGDLATLTYEAEAGVPAVFNFSSFKALDASGAKLNNAKAVVVMYGDANNDGLINIVDLIRLKKVTAGQASVITGKERNYDLNKDGSRNASDLTALVARLLAR